MTFRGPVHPKLFCGPVHFCINVSLKVAIPPHLILQLLTGFLQGSPLASQGLWHLQEPKKSFGFESEPTMADACVSLLWHVPHGDATRPRHLLSAAARQMWPARLRWEPWSLIVLPGLRRSWASNLCPHPGHPARANKRVTPPGLGCPSLASQQAEAVAQQQLEGWFIKVKKLSPPDTCQCPDLVRAEMEGELRAQPYPSTPGDLGSVRQITFFFLNKAK